MATVNEVPLIEAMYVGSFIADIREPDLLLSRKDIAITPEVMTHDVTKFIYQAILDCNADRIEPTVVNIANMCVLKDYSSNLEGVRKFAEYLNLKGASTKNEFASVEKILSAEVLTRNLTSVPAKIQAIISSEKPATEKLEETIELIRSLNGKIVQNSPVLDAVLQRQESESYVNDIREKIRNKVRKITLPPHWGVIHNAVTSINKGDLAVLSGGTGEGKSALSMHAAEWLAYSGHHVLVIHLEDNFNRIAVRRATRWIPDCSVGEIENGDPNDRLKQMMGIVESWETNGGSIVYKDGAGMSPDDIIAYLNAHVASGRPLDVVVLDYFQKALDNIKDMKENERVGKAGVFAEDLRNFGLINKALIMAVSQETVDSSGGKKTAWSKALTDKCQLWFSLERLIAEEDEAFLGLKDTPTIIAHEGSKSVWGILRLIKANNNPLVSAQMIMHGPRALMQSPEYTKAARSKDYKPYAPVYTAWSDRQAAVQRELFAALDNALLQAETGEFAPGKKKKAKAVTPPKTNKPF